MSVKKCKRASGVVYGVENVWNGKRAWELVGPVKREAQIRDRAMQKEIADGTYQPKAGARAVTLAQYGDTWLNARTNASAGDERRSFRLYVLSRPWLANKRLDEVRPADTDRVVTELRAEKKPSGDRRLSDKTIANLLGVLGLIFNAAVRAELCIRNPINLEPGTLKRAPRKEKETYTAGELVVLTRHDAIPWPIRILNALCLLAGLREGEACGRRWRDLTETTLLACLSVHDQYDGRKLKTDRPRMVPVHTELARLLEQWATEGFELYTGRPPTPDDFIVPNAGRRSKGQCHTRSSYYKAFIKYAEAAGVRPRSLHATRHTFLTLCRRGGARKDVLERVTHNARGDIVDRYTHFDWAPLCEAVSCLKIDVHRDLPPGPSNPDESRSPPSLPDRANAQESSALPVALHGSIPGASTLFL